MIREKIVKFLSFITQKKRDIVNPTFKKGAFVYNVFRCYEYLFGRKKGVRPECSAGRVRDEKGERTYIVFHTWEAYFTYQESMIREFAFAFAQKIKRLINSFEIKKIPIYLPEFIPLTEYDYGYEKKPIGYVYAVAMVSQGNYAAAAPQDTTYDNSAAFTLTVSGTNPFLVMGQNVQSGDNIISAVKWDSAGVNETLTQLTKLDAGSVGFYGFNYIYYRKAPSAGTTKRITATLSTNTFDRAGATSFSGVHQTDPIETFLANNATGTSNTASMTVSNTNCLGWAWFQMDNSVSTNATQPTGYATDVGNDSAQCYSNSTLSTGSNSLTWSTNTGSQRNTQLAVAIREATTSVPTLQVKVGTYTGTGGTSGTRSVSGFGFIPKFIFVWSADTSEIYPVWCMDSAVAGLGACGAFLGENGWFTTTTADRVQSFDGDGFTIAIGSSTTASLKALNGNAITFHYLALGGVDVETGSYTGNGVDNRNITGHSFQVGLAWLMGGARHAAFKTTATGISTDSSSGMYNVADVANKIQALNSDGFQVGTAVESNENTTVYYYVVVKDGTNFKSGQYTGDGTDNKDITTVGFQPDFVFIKGTGAVNSVLRSSTHSGDLSKYYRSSGFVANYIQSFLSNGFQVGTAGDVNTNTSVYSYLAIKVPTVGGGGGATYIPKISQN